MATAWRYLKRTLLTLLLAALSYSAWALWTYRDLSVEVLIERYGGDNLQVIDIDGLPLYYRLDGRPLGEAPVLLLIHSHFFNSRMWDGWVEPLADRFTLLRFDMSSHGLTGPDPSGDYSMARSLDIIHRLLQQLQLERVALVGSSLGGNMAFHYAAQYPQQASHLVLINSGGLKREQNSRRNASGIPDWAEWVLRLLPASAYRAFLEWMIVDDALVTDALLREFQDMFRRQGNRAAEIERLRGFDVGEPEAALARVRAPTLVLWGEANPQLPPALADAFVAKLINAPRVEKQLFAGAGHVLPLERPQASAAAVAQFILESADGK